MALAVDVDAPSAGIELGCNVTDTSAAGPAICVRIACPEALAPESVAVIVGLPAVVELVSDAVYVPSPLSATEPNWMPGSLDEKATVSPVRGLLPGSVIVAFAVEVEFPSATIVLGCSDTTTVGASARDVAAKHHMSAVAAAQSAATAENRERSF